MGCMSTVSATAIAAASACLCDAATDLAPCRSPCLTLFEASEALPQLAGWRRRTGLPSC